MQTWDRLKVVRRALTVAATALCFPLIGCNSVTAPKPTAVSVMLQASATVNPDLRKRASPLVIRIVELKSSAAFDSADFVSLYERDQATLAQEMNGREEFTLRPGETRQWDKTVDGGVRFIGVVAAFRDLEQARWKTVVALKPNKRNTIKVLADNVTLTAEVVEP